jgi:hypothetical protein
MASTLLFSFFERGVSPSLPPTVQEADALSTNSRIFPKIEHSRHRSPLNFVVHLIADLIAYSHQDKKPSLHFDERALLAA